MAEYSGNRKNHTLIMSCRMMKSLYLIRTKSTFGVFVFFILFRYSHILGKFHTVHYIILEAEAAAAAA